MLAKLGEVTRWLISSSVALIINTWRFPEMGLPPSHPIFLLGCSIINIYKPSSYWGTSICGNPQTRWFEDHHLNGHGIVPQLHPSSSALTMAILSYGTGRGRNVRRTKRDQMNLKWSCWQFIGIVYTYQYLSSLHLIPSLCNSRPEKKTDRNAGKRGRRRRTGFDLLICFKLWFYPLQVFHALFNFLFMFLFCRFFLGPEWATRVLICDMFWHDGVHKPHMETSLGTKDEPRSTGP